MAFQLKFLKSSPDLLKHCKTQKIKLMRTSILRAVLVLLACTFSLSTLWAQSPEKISYQAVIRNSNEALITNALIGMKISILKGAANGAAVYVETQTPLSNANGLVSIEIGTGSTTGNFSDIDWTNGPFYIKTETDPTGGTAYNITGVSQLLSVPFALHSKTAQNVAVSVSATGDTLYIGSEKWVIVPGISVANAYTGTTVTDADGNVYPTVTIGTQEWMAENLRTTKYKNGTSIPLVTSASAWNALSTPGFCWYNNDQPTYGETYGALYNWFAVETWNLCPTGWHVPTDAEWTTLTDYLGGEPIAGQKLKEAGSAHWNESGYPGTNESGFNGRGAGMRTHLSASFGEMKVYAVWWSATPYDPTESYLRNIWYGDTDIERMSRDNRYGMSIRCMKN